MLLCDPFGLGFHSMYARVGLRVETEKSLQHGVEIFAVQGFRMENCVKSE